MSQQVSRVCNGVSRILLGFHFGGRGEFQIFLEKWGYLHGEKRHAARDKATRLLGDSGACSPEKILINGAIWCVWKYKNNR